MAKKNKTLANWGSILGAIAGILWVLVGIFIVLDEAAGGFTDAFNTLNWVGNLGGGLEAIVIGIIWIVIGALATLLSIGRFGLNWIVIGILLIVFAVIGSGIPAILALIGGIYS